MMHVHNPSHFRTMRVLLLPVLVNIIVIITLIRSIIVIIIIGYSVLGNGDRGRGGNVGLLAHSVVDFNRQQIQVALLQVRQYVRINTTLCLYVRTMLYTGVYVLRAWHVCMHHATHRLHPLA